MPPAQQRSNLFVSLRHGWVVSVFLEPRTSLPGAAWPAQRVGDQIEEHEAELQIGKSLAHLLVTAVGGFPNGAEIGEAKVFSAAPKRLGRGTFAAVRAFAWFWLYRSYDPTESCAPPGLISSNLLEDVLVLVLVSCTLRRAQES